MRYITLFTYGFRPLKDHILGLLCSLNEEEFYKMIIFSDTKDPDILKAIEKIDKNKISLISSKKLFQIFKYCLLSDLIFGNPKGIKKYIIFLAQLINRNAIRVFLTPGIILKATGYFKRERPAYYFSKLHIRNVLVNILFRFIIITPTNEFMIYLSAAFFYPTNLLINYPLPKNIFFSSKVCNQNKKNIILFSPTHRWDNEISPIEILLSDEKFINSISNKNFQIRYTLHPLFPKQKVKFCESVSLFDSDWENVFSLVTDYSSIGYDYLYAGGGNLIYYIPDIIKFEANQGNGPLFESHINQNLTLNTKQQLLDKLNYLMKMGEKVNNFENKNLNMKFKNYFYNLNKKCRES